MHVLYVHQNFPAQFGHIAAHLVKKLGWRATYFSLGRSGRHDGIECIQYRTTGGATENNHFCSRTFENYVWHADGIFQALRHRPDVKPDLIVAHAGLAASLFLRELYPDVPVIGFFEFYYRVHHPLSDMTFRSDLPWRPNEAAYLRARCRNAAVLLELQNCQVGYSPTVFQRECFPAEYQPKLRTIFDGIDRAIYHGRGDELRPPIATRGPRTIAGVPVPAGTRVVTYVSRGFETMRGFDLFMKAARLISKQRDDVLFLIAGDDRAVYGGDATYLKGKTLKQWVLEQNDYDLSRFKFLGTIPQATLAEMLAASDLHIYLTVPFVLSWSMMNAMSCGAVVLGGRTAPVEEMIIEGQTGLIADFFSPADIADKALKVLADPDAFRPLGKAAEQMIADRYSLDASLPQMVKLYEEARQIKTGLESPREQAKAVPRQVMAGKK